MSDSCRTVVFGGDGTYEVRTVDVPEPEPAGAVLRVEAVGLCASDVAQLHGHKHVPNEVAPVVPGHEIVGTIHALGPDADFGHAVGTRVGVDLVRRCGTCAACTSHAPYCADMHVYGYSVPLDHRSGLYGGYGEYMEILPGTHLVELPTDVPASELSLFEPLASAINWVDLVRIDEGDSVLIQGPGHMGLICLAVAKQRGAGLCIVSGTGQDAHRLAAARQLGADHTIDVDAENLHQRVAELTGGPGAQVVMDMADAATQTVQLAVDCAAIGGRILLAGLKQMQPAQVVTDLIVFKSLTIVGGAGSTPAAMEAAGEMLREKVLPTADLLGEVLTLDELDEAMLLLQRQADRDTIRVTLEHR